MSQRYWVEHTESAWVVAESEDEAIQIVRDGGGDGYTEEWAVGWGVALVEAPGD